MNTQQAANRSCNRNRTNSNNFTSALLLLWSWIHYFVCTIDKQEKVAKLTAVVESNQGTWAVEEWTAEDEENLQRLKCSEVDLDTLLPL